MPGEDTQLPPRDPSVDGLYPPELVARLRELEDRVRHERNLQRLTRRTGSHRAVQRIWPEMPEDTADEISVRLMELDLRGALETLNRWEMSVRWGLTREHFAAIDRRDDKHGAVLEITERDRLADVPDHTLYRSVEAPHRVWVKHTARGGQHWLDIRYPSDPWYRDEALPLPGLAWLPPKKETSA